MATQLISARVSTQQKARFRTLAQRLQISESGLLKQLVDTAIRGACVSDADAASAQGRQLRGSRSSIRLPPDDKLILSERAAARQMAVATYISVIVRAHLRNLSPLPKAELMALRQSVAELGAIGRNLNQLTRIPPHDRQGPGREDLLAILRVCEGLRDHTKALIKANARSWKAGHEPV